MNNAASERAAMEYIARGLVASQRQNLSDDDGAGRLWHRAIQGFAPQDIVNEFDELQLTITSYLTPPMLHTRLKALQASRINDAGNPPTPGVSPGDGQNYAAWIRQWRLAVGNGADADAAQELADQWARDNDCYLDGLRGEPTRLPSGFSTKMTALARAMPTDQQ